MKKQECMCDKKGKCRHYAQFFGREHLFALQPTAIHFLVNQNSKRHWWWSYIACATNGWVVVNPTVLCRKWLNRIMSPSDSNLVNLKHQAGAFAGGGMSQYSTWDIFFCLAEGSVDSRCPTQCQKLPKIHDLRR